MIALLRGINVGPHNRIAMPALREHLTALGYAHVRTLIASGNIVLDAPAAGLAGDLRAAIKERFGVDTPVIVRTAAELAAVVEGNPLPVPEPGLFHVAFCDAHVPERDLGDLGEERVAFAGREIYCWHAGGMQRSPLAKALAKIDVAMTARNWNTVLRLLEMTRAA